MRKWVAISTVLIFSLFSFSAFCLTFEEKLQKVKSFGQQNGYIEYPNENRAKHYTAQKNQENINTQLIFFIQFHSLAFVGIECLSCATKDMAPKDHALCKKEFSALYMDVFGRRPDLSHMKLQVTATKKPKLKSADGKVISSIRTERRCVGRPHQGYNYTLHSTDF